MAQITSWIHHGQLKRIARKTPNDTNIHQQTPKRASDWNRLVSRKLGTILLDAMFFIIAKIEK